jgi:tetratricopeptide (TPR) repeat protein
MTPLPRPFSAAIAPFLPGFREIERRLGLLDGFVLFPVEVPGPDVARALGDYLTDRGRPALVIEPRDDAQGWADITATLVRATPAQNGIVLLIGSADPPESIHAGLRLLNQRRETLTKRFKALSCPLLCCGPVSFLNLCWEGAPDFWSIRATDYRFAAPGASAEVLPVAQPSSVDDTQALRGAPQVHPGFDESMQMLAELSRGRSLEDAGNLAEAEAAYRRALQSARAGGDAETVARALIGAYGIVARTGRAAEAEAPLQEAQHLAQRIGDRALEAAALSALSFAAAGAYDEKKAQEQVEHAKAIMTEEQKRKGRPARIEDPINVLILTALQDELEAVLALGDGGRAEWVAQRDLGGFPYFRRSFSSDRGGSFTVAAAWIGEMGERTAAIRGQQLLHELDPSCLAMCGICAGYRKKVSLGDVIVADQLWRYDEGKRVEEPGKGSEFSHA